jgi:hypothetical protein
MAEKKEKGKVVKQKPSLIRYCLILHYSYYPADAAVNILPCCNEISTPLAKTATNNSNRTVGTYIILLLIIRQYRVMTLVENIIIHSIIGILCIPSPHPTLH